MAIYNRAGERIATAYSIDSSSLAWAYDGNGTKIYSVNADYSNYSYTQKWASKGISAQGFDIYNDIVFWISKSGDDTIPANCYVWNLSDGTQALSAQPVTIYSGHGNNICFDYPTVYCSPAYPPSRVYVNTVSADFLTYALDKTLTFNDGTADLDCCIDENNSSIMWTYGHISGASTTNILSKWDLSDLTDNGDGTYTPTLLHSVNVTQPQNSRYFQGCKFHDGILWVANGYSGSSTGSYVFGIDPISGEYLYTIDCETTEEPEGVAWYPDSQSAGGYALYVGFAGMMLRKYTFAELA